MKYAYAKKGNILFQIIKLIHSDGEVFFQTVENSKYELIASYIILIIIKLTS